jgi:hypothetical protein
MAIDHPSPKALELLTQFAPQDVLERARDLARQIEQDEYVKNYIARRGFSVAVAAILVTLVFCLVTGVLLTRLPITISSLAGWQRIAALGFGAIFCTGGTVTSMYFILSWLRRGALAERAQKEKAGIE